MKLGYARVSTTDQDLSIQRARPNCGRSNAPSLAISLKKENPSPKSPGPSMSMSQRSIAAYATRRPYVSRPFLSHARSKDWIEESLSKLSRKSDLTRAVHCTLGRWPALLRYGDDRRLKIDNNAAERALRAVALGRKNCLFAGSDSGGGTGHGHEQPDRLGQAQWRRSGSLFVSCSGADGRPPHPSHRGPLALERRQHTQSRYCCLIPIHS